MDNSSLFKNLKNKYNNDIFKNKQEIDKLNNTITNLKENLNKLDILISKKQDEKLKIKYNNKILHQSKLINYFNGEASKEKVERDLDKMFKKIKKNKKYYFSTKDNILIESFLFFGNIIAKSYFPDEIIPRIV